MRKLRFGNLRMFVQALSADEHWRWVCCYSGYPIRQSKPGLSSLLPYLLLGYYRTNLNPVTRHLKGLDPSGWCPSYCSCVCGDPWSREQPEGNGCLSACSSGLGSTDASGTQWYWDAQDESLVSPGTCADQVPTASPSSVMGLSLLFPLKLFIYLFIQ